MIFALVWFVTLVWLWPHVWIHRDGLKYLKRWPLYGGDGLRRAPWPLSLATKNLFLHAIVLSDAPIVHSHPYDAKALILWGRYRDTRYNPVTGETTWCDYRPGQVNDIPAGAFHTLKVLSPFVVTLFWTGKKHGQGWGFLVNGKFINASGDARAAYERAKKAAGLE